ncbi:hypothetical protein StoSoilB3_41940 (plasmid) [Arthrobacter sp. StoSoilB3]|nr:hypothetical protein StoSoilB3_41940 [Arthrobacter sp. StoSoilB3]
MRGDKIGWHGRETVVVIDRRHDMHMRIDQARHQEASSAVNDVVNRQRSEGRIYFGNSTFGRSDIECAIDFALLGIKDMDIAQEGCCLRHWCPVQS